MDIFVKELKERDELSTIYDIVGNHYDGLTKTEFDKLLDDMLPMGYRCICAYDKADKTQTIIGISGFWIKSQFYCRKSLRVDNFIITDNMRGNGVGKSMLEWLENEAKNNDCKIMLLDSKTGNTESHRFYFREGLKIIGFHFAKDIF